MKMFRKLKWKRQRAKRCFSDCDAYHISYWFEKTMPAILEHLQKHKHGYPCNMTPEEWDKELSQMIFYFKEMSEDTCSQENEYAGIYFDKVFGNEKGNKEEIEELKGKYLKREDELYDYRRDMRTKALDMFNKYYESLWD